MSNPEPKAIFEREKMGAKNRCFSILSGINKISLQIGPAAVPRQRNFTPCLTGILRIFAGSGGIVGGFVFQCGAARMVVYTKPLRRCFRNRGGASARG